MMYHKAKLESKIKMLEDRHLLRRMRVYDKSYIDFSSNNYLQIAHHPDVIHALINGAQAFGLGNASSPLVSGYHEMHAKLESELATLMQRPHALIFGSGYLANIAAITTLADRKQAIIADKECHASLVDGIRLSAAKLHRYQHQNLAACGILLKDNPASILISESTFSTNGNITNIKNLANLARQHHALLMIDDAHGLGIAGLMGGGVGTQCSALEVPCITASLGKALGCVGGVVAGEHWLIESVIQFARSYRYTIALPPMFAMAALASIKVIKNETWRAKKLYENINHFNRLANKKNLQLMNSDNSPIRSLQIHQPKQAAALENYLREQKIKVTCLRPPSVPNNQSIIRISLNCLHNLSQIDKLLEHIAYFLGKENVQAMH